MKEKRQLSEEDLLVLEMVDDTVFFGEYINSTSEDIEEGEGWEFNNYQMMMLNDLNHRISVCTGRATGKCQIFSDKILLSNGNYCQIGDLNNKEFEVVCYDENILNQVTSKARVFYNSYEECFKVKTSYGLEINVTNNHPFYTVGGWKELKDLKNGDYIAVPTEIPYFGNTDISDNELKILAYLIADGCITKSIRFSTANSIYLDDFTTSVKQFDCSVKYVGKYDYRVIKNSGIANKVMDFLRELDLFGKNSHTKFIPDIIFKTTKENVKLFLSRLYACDGWVTKKEIGYCSVSRDIAYSVRSLLLKFGIFASIQYKPKTKAYAVLVSSIDSYNKFKEELYIYGKPIPEYINSSKLNDTSDIIPISKKKFKTLEKQTGWYRTLRYIPTRLKLSKCVNLDEQTEKLIKAPLRWVKIKSIKSIGFHDTYGVEVDKYSNYISSDILVHNTASLEIRIIHDVISNKYNKASENEVLLVCQNKNQLEPVFLRLAQKFRRHPLLKFFVNNASINFGDHLIKLLNGSMIRGRIVGSTADSNIIGLHVPAAYIDEAQVFSYVAYNSLMQAVNQWDEGYVVWVSGVPNGLREKNVLYEADAMDDRFSRHRLSRLQSPRYTEEQHKADLKQYGGEQGDDYTHLILGAHGSPAFSVFDRKLMKISDYPVTISTLNNLGLEVVGGRFHEILNVPEFNLEHDLVCCYSSDTEVLTEDGWKLFKDLNKTEKVATLNPKSNELEYHKPSDYQEYYHNGEMISIDSRFVNLLVTPDHNLYVAHNKRGGYLNNRFEHVKAGDVYNESLRFKKVSNWFGIKQNYFELPSIVYGVNKYINKEVPPLKIDMDTWLEFLGYYLSEGCVSSGYRTCLSQSKSIHLEYYTKIERCLKKLPFHYRSTDTEFVINNKQLYVYLKQFGKSYEKFIPKEVKLLSKEQLLILFNALMLGGGYKRDNTYSTCSQKLADDIQEVLLKLGYSGSIKSLGAGRGSYYKKEDRYIISKHQKYVINFQTKYLEPQLNTRNTNHMRITEYNGTVYCLTVKNHIIYVRRNGKPVWCGQCGVDAGFSNDPTILTILYQNKGLWREFARYELRRIKYPTQAKIIDWLDNIIGFNMITLDAGSSGLALGQMLQELEEFKHKNYSKRLILVDFQGSVVIGFDEEGKEQKDRIRKFTIQQLQRWSQNEQLIEFSMQDEDMISELERVGFTRDMLGQPKFFVYSAQGGQKGDDHILASLLTWVYGFYYNYYSPEKPKTKGKYSDLAKGGWNIRHGLV